MNILYGVTNITFLSTLVLELVTVLFIDLNIMLVIFFINLIQNKCFCLHYICVYCVYLLCIYKYTHMHAYIYI